MAWANEFWFVINCPVDPRHSTEKYPAGRFADATTGFVVVPREGRYVCLECGAVARVHQFKGKDAAQEYIGKLYARFAELPALPTEVDPMSSEPVVAEGNVSELPTSFTEKMVRKILDDQKTHTRRVLAYSNPTGANHGAWTETGQPGYWQCKNEKGDTIFAKCRHGGAGDKLWVREPFRVTVDGSQIEYSTGEKALIPDELKYLAVLQPYGNRWRPAMYLPKNLARIHLEVTGVRPERLQDISEDDAKAEGAEGVFVEGVRSYREGFRILWDSIHITNREHMWQANPEVWAITFTRLV